MRDADAIREIADMQTKATRLQALSISDPRNAYYDQRGTVIVQPLPIPVRQHTVNTIESFSEAITRYGKDATVWCTLDKVRTILNDTDEGYRCDAVSLPITPSDCFKVLQSQDWTTQKNLIDTLRHSLAAATLDPANTLSVLRNLKFATQTEETGKFEASAAAMGKSVASQVSGDSALPETVSVEFHPFPSLADEIDVSVVVFCTLFTDPATAKLKLSPRQGELDKAKTTAIRALRDTIAKAVKDGTPVFIGTP